MAFKRKTDTGTATSVKFNKVGDSVEGVYLGGTLDENGKFGPVVKHLFDTEDGMKVAFSKRESQMTRILSGEEGKRIRLTFESSKPSGKGNNQKIYAVEVDDEFDRLSNDQLVSSQDDEESTADTNFDDEQPRTLSTAEKRARVQELLKSKRG